MKLFNKKKKGVMGKLFSPNKSRSGQSGTGNDSPRGGIDGSSRSRNSEPGGWNRHSDTGSAAGVGSYRNSTGGVSEAAKKIPLPAVAKNGLESSKNGPAPAPARPQQGQQQRSEHSAEGNSSAGGGGGAASAKTTTTSASSTAAQSRTTPSAPSSSSAAAPPPSSVTGRGGANSGGASANAAAGSNNRSKSMPIKITPRRVSSGADRIYEDEALARAYDSIPVLELTELPRGGVSMETAALGRVQFGIPPETIKDSMRLGLGVPSVYIVPVERFCRETGPALGVNLAEFEFPAYFNFFVQRKRCTLIVDSDDAERNIRDVFSETLLGPEQFRRENDAITNEAEDFDPDFPVDMRPNFEKEFRHFRIMPDGKELVLETLLKFRHFHPPGEGGVHHGLGVPPDVPAVDGADGTTSDGGVANATKSDTAALFKRTSMPEDMGEEDDEVPPSPAKPQVMKPSTSMPDINAHDGKEEHLATEIIETSAHCPWTYAQAKWIGDVSKVYPDSATEEDIASGNCKRVEIFKLPGGTEYILHDIDENNVIVGKARFSGNVQVHEFMSVDGFGGRDLMTELEKKPRRKSASTRTSFSSEQSDDDSSDDEECFLELFGDASGLLPPTFHPPSFGVTVLGNSHGFDKQGSTSGYVLWINGRGVMIDPPPYSTATLEREGIRPGTIVGIVLTHCHADHDAGAFQKILTDSRVAVITTPTIYKSFIRKYAALSALSPSLLRHSHRHIPAIIGSPLRFQGATFHFTYTLHTIPCVGFRVEWRGRSMVFTGDHFNSPPAIDMLQETGVLSKDRADDLRQLPLQETDLLLHEAGAPPIHTPLEVLKNLPARVKKHLYVVHTSALPEGCELRVAPTGTAGTIRLDELKSVPGGVSGDRGDTVGPMGKAKKGAMRKASMIPEDLPLQDEIIFQSILSNNEYEYEDGGKDLYSSFSQLQTGQSRRNTNRLNRMSFCAKNRDPPLVSLRPASSTDAWFILNLLSAVPFLSSLSYASTMEVLESARVDAFCVNDVVVPANRREDVLCVVWEGTCMEREHTEDGISEKRALLQNGGGRGRNRTREVASSILQVTHGRHTPLTEAEINSKKKVGVWQAGDWTGPRSLQPEKRLSGESSTSRTHDIVAMSSQGVKVITVEFSNLHAILKSGSPLYRKYLIRSMKQGQADHSSLHGKAENSTQKNLLERAMQNLNLIELIECNSALAKLSAVQKRHLESLAEGPVFYRPDQCLWKAGATADKAFIIVEGAVSFVSKDKSEQKLGVRGDGPGESRVVPVGGMGNSPDGGDRFANRVLGRFHSRRADVSSGIIFTRGHFLGDISKMVAGLLSKAGERDDGLEDEEPTERFAYGQSMGDESVELDPQGLPVQQGSESHEGTDRVHSSTLAAGENGCVVMVFPKWSLIGFLDKYPGFLLSLLGSQVVV